MTEENQRLRNTLVKVCEALGNGARCSNDCALAFLERIPEEVGLVIRRLKAEIAEADRRAGQAERLLAHGNESKFARDAWLSQAKKDWGVSDNVSFDVVWEEALRLKRQVE